MTVDSEARATRRADRDERRVSGHVRRALALPLGVLVSAALAVGLSACGSSGSPGYQVRAIFDDAGNVIPGENVKIAGVTVGSVSALAVTPQQKAAVVLNITNPGFQDFRTDASCIIRPEALIGEMYVECSPTQPRAVGTPEPPPLPVVPSGQPGAGEHYLPVTNTSSPVGIDLIGDVARLPYTQRLTVIINELGAGLAGNGQALEQVVQRADPTLAALDNVLAILASENHTLAALARDSNTVIAPLAAQRAQVADFIGQANTVATVQAEHRVALGETLAKLPGFLDQLVPTLRELSRFSDAANPVLANLTAAAPSVNEAVQKLTPFSQGATSYLTSLGQTAQKGTPEIKATLPVVQQLGALGTASKPFAQSTATLLQGLDKQGGLTGILQFLFGSALSGNGYDADGHFVRSFPLILGSCISYQISEVASCNANFPTSGSTASASSARAARASSPSAASASAASASAAQAVTASAAGSAASPSSSTDNTLLSYLLGN